MNASGTMKYHVSARSLNIMRSIGVIMAVGMATYWIERVISSFVVFPVETALSKHTSNSPVIAGLSGIDIVAAVLGAICVASMLVMIICKLIKRSMVLNAKAKYEKSKQDDHEIGTSIRDKISHAGHRIVQESHRFTDKFTGGHIEQDAAFDRKMFLINSKSFISKAIKNTDIYVVKVTCDNDELYDSTKNDADGDLKFINKMMRVSQGINYAERGLLYSIVLSGCIAMLVACAQGKKLAELFHTTHEGLDKIKSYVFLSLTIVSIVSIMLLGVSVLMKHRRIYNQYEDYEDFAKKSGHEFIEHVMVQNFRADGELRLPSCTDAHHGGGFSIKDPLRIDVSNTTPDAMANALSSNVETGDKKIIISICRKGENGSGDAEVVSIESRNCILKNLAANAKPGAIMDGIRGVCATRAFKVQAQQEKP